MEPTENFKDYIPAFVKKLDRVKVEDITPALYIRKYLTYLLEHKKYYLAIYADVLHKLVQHSTNERHQMVLMDFGCGNGLLGIFAKFCGFKKVFLVDIDPKFVHASQQVAMSLNIAPDGYITGDIDAARSFFKNEVPDAVIGTDVIEHIYDLEKFFKGIRQLNPAMVSVFTTASNPCNYYKLRLLRKIQLKDELEGGTPDDHIFFGEHPSAPFLDLRAQVIRKYFNELTGDEILRLAKATRGLNEPGIVKATGQYKISEILPIPAEGTNTCDPFTGCWTERVLSLEAYTSLYQAAGFQLHFYSGFYNEYEGGYKKYLKKILNAAIAVAGKRIAPYIIITGVPT